MRHITSQEDILKSIREALMERAELKPLSQEESEQPLFVEGDADPAMAFAKAYTAAGGTMFYTTTEEELKARLVEVRRDMNNAAIACCNDNLTQFMRSLGFADSFTSQPGQRHPLGALVCDALVTWNGSIIISSKLGLGSNMQQLPASCIVIAFTSQLMADWQAALVHLRETYPGALPDEIVTVTAKDCHKPYLILVEDQ